MGSAYAPYEVKLSSLEACESLLETIDRWSVRRSFWHIDRSSVRSSTCCSCCISFLLVRLAMQSSNSCEKGKNGVELPSIWSQNQLFGGLGACVSDQKRKIEGCERPKIEIHSSDIAFWAHFCF